MYMYCGAMVETFGGFPSDGNPPLGYAPDESLPDACGVAILNFTY